MDTGASVLDVGETWRRFRLPALVCTALLALSFARAYPLASERAAWTYRNNAFARLAYSDVIALHADRGATRHRVPYLADRIEYPVGLGVAMYVPSLVAPEPQPYFALCFALQSLGALVTLWAASRIRTARPWGWAASPALVAYAQLNWDLFAIGIFAAGLLAYARGRHLRAVVALTLATWTKFFPVVALAPVLAKTFALDRRAAVRLLLVAVAITVCVNGPFALLAYRNWSFFFDYNRTRSIEPSLYHLAGFDDRRGVPLANAISAATMALAGLAVLVRALRRRPLDVVATSGALVTLWLLANKVFSPQYWLWVLAAMSLAGISTPFVLAAGLFGALEYVTTFSVINHSGHGLLMPMQHAVAAWYWQVVWARYAFLAVSLVLLVRREVSARAVQGA